MEKPLKEALAGEFLRRGETGTERLKALWEAPFLQTAHHLTPTNGPTFLANDVICLAGKPARQGYFVGACSGVAFSNPARSGSLCFGSSRLEALIRTGTSAFRKNRQALRELEREGIGERRIRLVPQTWRDALLFSAPMPESLLAIWEDFSEKARSLLPSPARFEAYSDWALEACETTQREILDEPDVFYFDLNRVVNDYLLRVLGSDGDHLLKRLLTGQGRGKETDGFKGKELFLENVPVNGKCRVNTIDFETFKTRCGKDDLEKALEKGRWCPSAFLTFFAVAFLSGVRCCGSFRQRVYLRRWLEGWRRDFPERGEMVPAAEASPFSGGRVFRNSRPLYPLDCRLQGERLSLAEFGSFPVGSLWEGLRG